MPEAELDLLQRGLTLVGQLGERPPEVCPAIWRPIPAAWWRTVSNTASVMLWPVRREEGLGLVPETEDEKRLRARIAAGRARLIACGYEVTEPDESELSGMTVVEILHRGRERARARWEQRARAR